MDNESQHSSEALQTIPTIALLDLGAVILFPKDRDYKGKLNPLYAELSQKPNFNFSDHFELNTPLLNHLSSLKEAGLTLYMVTEGTIQNVPDIKLQLEAVFTKIFSGKEFGLSKQDPELYHEIVKKIGTEAKSIVFIDDSSGNIAAAKEAGFATIHHQTNDETIKNIDHLFNL